MNSYLEMNKSELEKEFESVKSEYETHKAKGLKLDMSRGKPCKDNVMLSKNMLDVTDGANDFLNEDGVDCLNYGGIEGIKEMRALFADILGMPASQVIIGGNSSLNLMFDAVSQGMTHGFGDKPWYETKNRKFLCPVPGYDRHFAVTEYFGFELIPIEMDENGPDMDKVERLVKDESVKGIWCVPKYSNPEGVTYSDEVVKRFAALKPAAKDFKIFWDNAYCVHDLYGDGDKLLNLYEECIKSGNEDLPIIFASTSKITFPGAGVSAMAASEKVLNMLKCRIKYQTVGPDKLNMLLHARFLHNKKEVTEHMKKHAELIRPKFESVISSFESELTPAGIAHWTNPKGGYFISLYVLDGCAKRTCELCKEAGVVLTGAGATYPYGKDEKDSNLRIAPTYPSLEELKKATEVLCTAVKYAALEKLLNN